MITYHEFERLTAADKAIYQTIMEQLLHLSATLQFTSVGYEKIFSLYNKVLLDHPEIFWLKQAGNSRIVRSRLGETVYFTPAFHEGMNASTVPAMKRQIESSVSAIVNRASRLKGEYAKVLYVHDFLVDNTRYSFGPNCYDVYGCLIQHRAVCAGYAATFQLLLHKLGISCGRISGLKIDSLSSQADHEWNYCRIDNQYYYVDVTWDDPVSLGLKTDVKTHHYFCLSEKELALSHRLEKGEGFIPVCNSTRYNYYVYHNMNVGTYSFAHVYQIIAAQLKSSNEIHLKFDTKLETERAVADLLHNNKIYNIPGIPPKLSYSTSKSGLILTVNI